LIDKLRSGKIETTDNSVDELIKDIEGHLEIGKNKRLPARAKINLPREKLNSIALL